MRIRPKSISYTEGISTVTPSNPNSTWFTRVGGPILDEIYKKLEALYNKYKTTRSEEDYNAYALAVQELNNDQKQYSRGYELYITGNERMFKDPYVGEWQTVINEKYPYINKTIGNNWSQYDIQSKSPNSGDNEGNDWGPDNLWAGLTLDRTPWGFTRSLEDSNYKKWLEKFKEIGIDYHPEKDVLYGTLAKKEDLDNLLKGKSWSLDVATRTWDLIKDKVNLNPEEGGELLAGSGEDDETGEIPTGTGDYTTLWDKLKRAGASIINNPNLWTAGEFINTWLWNDKIYNEAEKGIIPTLLPSYHTHRQVIGDEATKLAYYRRAAQGEARAAQPFVSDADKYIAYRNEAKRVGDLGRALGDLADNQETRRTSDESNQHEWANTERDNQTARLNIAEMILARKNKHMLRALKASAQGSSINNLFKEIKTKLLKKKERLLDINDSIFELEEALYEDLDLLEAKSKYEEAYEASKDPITKTPNYKSQALLNAKDEYLKAIARAKERSLLRKKRYIMGGDPHLFDEDLYYFKSGSKITKKRKDDLLYKSARDVVEHFRKMSKIVSDDSKRPGPKPEKLVSHPKGSTRKYLLGGLAPFLVYTPTVLGGETTTSSETSTSHTKKSDKDDEGQDLLKKLFEHLYSASGLGLPSDVNAIFSSIRNLIEQKQFFGTELSTDEIQMAYLESMLNLNLLKYNLDEYNKVRTSVDNNDALEEYALDNSGRIAVQNLKKSGKVEFVEWEKLKKGLGKEYRPLTNLALLNLRATSSDLALDNEILTIVLNNGIGLSKIIGYLNDLISKVNGYTESTLEGYTSKESKLIKEGVALLHDAPEGIYKFTLFSKDLKELIAAALKYLTLTLPRNMRNVLDTRAKMMGLSYADFILEMLTAGSQSSTKLEFAAITGKAATNSSSGSSKSDGDSENSAALAFVQGQGSRILMDLNPGTSNAIRVLGIKGTILDTAKKNLGLGSTLLDVTNSLFAFLNFDEATFGGSRLNSGAYSHVILNNSTIVSMDLPYTTDINGNDVPNFLMLHKMEEADKVIAEQKIEPTDYKKINEIYKSKDLPPKYDSEGKLNPIKYKRYAAIQVTLDESALKNLSAILKDEVALAEDVERDLYREAMKKSNKDYNLSDGTLGIDFLGKDKLYKGTLFIPYDEDLSLAALSGGRPFKSNLPDNVKEVLEMQYAPKAKTYKPADNFSQIKDK